MILPGVLATILSFSGPYSVAIWAAQVDPVSVIGLLTAVAAVTGGFLVFFQNRERTQGDRGIQAVEKGIQSLEAALERADVEVSGLRAALHEARVEVAALRVEVAQLRNEVREKDLTIEYLKKATP